MYDNILHPIIACHKVEYEGIFTNRTGVRRRWWPKPIPIKRIVVITCQNSPSDDARIFCFFAVSHLYCVVHISFSILTIRMIDLVSSQNLNWLWLVWNVQENPVIVPGRKRKSKVSIVPVSYTVRSVLSLASIFASVDLLLQSRFRLLLKKNRFNIAFLGELQGII